MKMKDLLEILRKKDANVGKILGISNLTLINNRNLIFQKNVLVATQYTKDVISVKILNHNRLVLLVFMILILDSVDFLLVDNVQMVITLIRLNQNVIIVSSNFQVVVHLVIKIYVIRVLTDFSCEMGTVKHVIVFIVKIVDFVMQKNVLNADKVLLYGLVFVGKTGDDYSDIIEMVIL